MDVYRFIEQSPTPAIPAGGIEVPRAEWKRSEGGVLFTQEIEPCIAVVVFDPASHTGLLGHFDLGATGKDRPVFDNFTRAVGQENLSSSKQAWVGGATSLAPPNISKRDSSIYHEMLDDNKMHTVEQLGRLGITRIRRDWLKTNQKITSLVFSADDEGSIAYQVKTTSPDG